MWRGHNWGFTGEKNPECFQGSFSSFPVLRPGSLSSLYSPGLSSQIPTSSIKRILKSSRLRKLFLINHLHSL